MFATVNNAPVTEGDTVTDFRGQEWSFYRVSRPYDYARGKTAMVEVKDEFDRVRLFYVTVFPGMDVVVGQA